jgi:hypothetical protein
MIELALIVIFSVLSLLFFYLYILQKRNNKAIIANAVKVLMMQEENYENNKTDKEKANEDFLKFVSDSRDWAYQYIDEVQTSLNKFITDIEPDIVYFKEYGDLGSMAPNYYSMKKISTAYEELKKLLPEDYDRIE